MFVGTWKRTLDEKWRLPLPADLLAPDFPGDRDTFYVAPGQGCLVLFSSHTFSKVAEQLSGRNALKHPDLRRRFYGSTYPRQKDKSGRIQIPEPLRDRSGLPVKGEVVIVGTGPYAELWPAGGAPEEEEGEALPDLIVSLGEALGE